MFIDPAMRVKSACLNLNKMFSDKCYPPHFNGMHYFIDIPKEEHKMDRLSVKALTVASNGDLVAVLRGRLTAKNVMHE